MSFDASRALAAQRRARARLARRPARHGDARSRAFAKLRRGPFAFLLESAPAGGETWARYTFLGTEPRAAWRLRDGVVDDWTPGAGWHGERRPADPLADLAALLTRTRPSTCPELGEFWSGAVGYFGYDVARLIERLPTPPPRGVDVPDALFVFTRRAGDLRQPARAGARRRRRARVAPDATDAALARAYDARRARRSTPRSRGCARPPSLPPLDLDPSAPPADGRVDVRARRSSSPTSSAFASTSSPATASRCCSRGASTCRSTSIRPSSIARCACSIRRRTCTTSCSTASRSSAARRSCSCACADGHGDGAPDRRHAAARRDAAEDDARSTAELLADEKERAEHVMLVDLGRNDVGRIARVRHGAA